MGMKKDCIYLPKFQGVLTLSKNGEILRQEHNLVTNIGKDFVLNSMVEGTADSLNYWSIGDGTTPPSEDDIDLENEATGGRTAATTRVVSERVLTITGQAAGGIYNQIWAEFGFFYGSTGSKLFSRIVFDPYTKVSGEVIDWSYKIAL